MARATFQIGKYALGSLNGEAVATWLDDDGRKRRYRLGSPRKPEAVARAALQQFVELRAMAEAQQGRHTTVAELFGAYRERCVKDGKVLSTMDANWKRLAPFFGPVDPLKITDDACREYAQSRFAAGIKAWTVHTELNRLRTVLAWSRAQRLISEDVRVWLPQPGKKIERVLDEDEMRRLIDACVSPHIRLFVIIGLCTGARMTAILELTWDRIDFDARTIDLRRAVDDDPMSKRYYKGRSWLHLNDTLLAELRAAKEAAITDHVIEYNSAPARSIKKGFAAAVRAAGLDTSGADKITPHTLRRTVASMLAAQDVPVEAVAGVLGHKSIKTTQAHYIKTRAAGGGVVDKLAPLGTRRLRAV